MKVLIDDAHFLLLKKTVLPAEEIISTPQLSIRIYNKESMLPVSMQEKAKHT